MCTGMEIAALAAVVGGTAMQYKASEDAKDRQDAYTALETERQGKLQREADAVAQASQDQYSMENFQQSADTQKDVAATRYQEAVADVGSKQLPGMGVLDAPKTIADEFDRQQAAAAARGGQRADAAAALTGLGEAFLGANLGASQNANRIRMLGGFQNGSANVLQQELAGVRPNAAMMAGGQLLAGVGQVGLGASLNSGPAVNNQTMAAATRPYGMGDFFVRGGVGATV